MPSSICLLSFSFIDDIFCKLDKFLQGIFLSQRAWQVFSSFVTESLASQRQRRDQTSQVFSPTESPRACKWRPGRWGAADTLCQRPPTLQIYKSKVQAQMKVQLQCRLLHFVANTNCTPSLIFYTSTAIVHTGSRQTI